MAPTIQSWMAGCPWNVPRLCSMYSASSVNSAAHAGQSRSTTPRCRNSLNAASTSSLGCAMDPNVLHPRTVRSPAVELGGKVVVVTGGGNGIGAALCRRFAAEGAEAVVVADLDGDGAAAVADEIGARAVTVDVSDRAQVEELVASTIRDHGRIDLFCANAGIGVFGGVEVERRRLAALLGRQRHGPRVRRSRPPTRLAGAGRRLPAPHGVGGRAADQHRHRALHGHQARGCRTGRVAVDDPRRCRGQGLLPLPHGRAHEHVWPPARTCPPAPS